MVQTTFAAMFVRSILALFGERRKINWALQEMPTRPQLKMLKLRQCPNSVSAASSSFLNCTLLQTLHKGGEWKEGRRMVKPLLRPLHERREGGSEPTPPTSPIVNWPPPRPPSSEIGAPRQSAEGQGRAEHKQSSHSTEFSLCRATSVFSAFLDDLPRGTWAALQKWIQGSESLYETVPRTANV